MGKRNKKAKASVTEARSTVNNKATPVAACKVSKIGNESKQKRTKDSERRKCRSYYYVALLVAVLSVTAIFTIPYVSSILGTSERPSYRLLTPNAEVDTAEFPEPMKETKIKNEKFEAASVEDNDYQTNQDIDSFDTHFEDADREVKSLTSDLLSGNEDTSSTPDTSNLREYNDAAGDSSSRSKSPEKVEKDPNKNEEDLLNKARDFDESVEKKQSEIYFTRIQEKDRIDDTSTYTTHHEGLDSDGKSVPDEERMPVNDSTHESDSDDESDEHHDHEIPEHDSGNTKQEQRIDQENYDEISDDIETDEAEASQPIDTTSEGDVSQSAETDDSSVPERSEYQVSDDIETDEAEASQPIDTTSEGDASQSAETDDSSVPEQSEYQDDSITKSSGEANQEGDVDKTDDNPRLVVDVNSRQIDKRDEINDDSLKQTQIDKTDDTTTETIPNEIDPNQNGIRLEIPSESANDEFSEQTNKDPSNIDETTTEAVTEILDGNQDDTDLEASSAIDSLNNQVEDEQLTRNLFEKEKIEAAKIPQPAAEETVVRTSKADDQDKEIETRSDPVIRNHQEREVEKTEPDEMKTGKPESEMNQIVDDDEDFDDEDEDEDEEEEVSDITTETKEATEDQKEEINEIFSQSIETDLNDSDENYMDVSKGVRKRILRMGTGVKIDAGDMITIHCIGYRDEDPPKQFWSTKDPSQRPFTFAVGKRQVIKGWDEGALSMTLHERSRIKIEPKKAYGKFGFEAWGLYDPAWCENNLRNGGYTTQTDEEQVAIAQE